MSFGQYDDIAAHGRRGMGFGWFSLGFVTSALLSAGILFGFHSGHIPLPSFLSAAAGQAPSADTVEVPRFVGLPRRAIPLLAEQLGLKVEIEEEREGSEGRPGDALEQTPEPGWRVKRDSVVRLVLAAGGDPGPGKVPAILGKTLDEARALLKKAGLVAGDVKKATKGKAGTVTAADPAPGTDVEAGTTVKLEAVPSKDGVPDLTSLNPREAQKALAAAGLKVGRTRFRFNANRGPNLVLAQSPEAGAELPGNKRIDVVINRWP